MIDYLITVPLLRGVLFLTQHWAMGGTANALRSRRKLTQTQHYLVPVPTETTGCRDRAPFYLIIDLYKKK